MATSLEVDFISPMNGTAVTVSPCLLTPTVTTHSASATAVTLTMSTVTIGKIVTLSISGVTFTGAGAPITLSAASTLTAPVANCYFPIMIQNTLTKAVGSLLLGTNKIIVLSADATGAGNFAAAATDAIYPAVLSYAIA